MLYALTLTLVAAPIFNGQSLEGFTAMGPTAWRVDNVDGEPAIVGVASQATEASWLYWPQPVSDFVLTAAFRLDEGSAQIAYRSAAQDDLVIQGYATTLEATNTTTGSLHDLNGRGLLTPLGARRRIGFQDNRQALGVVGDAQGLLADVTPGTWHTLRITANGPHLQHHIDGRLVSETWDEDPARQHIEGGFAFGLEPGHNTTVALRHIDVRATQPTFTTDNADTSQTTQLNLPPGFHAEKRMDVPRDQGSWVSMAFEPNGDLLVSPQRGRIRRVNPEAGTSTPIAIDIGHAQGMVYANNALYVIVSRDPPHGGLHRLTDTTGDGRYDTQEHLAVWGNGSEHGPHAIKQGPDGLLWIIQGNHTPLPPRTDLAQSPFQGWAEDLLLERQWDANGHAVGITAPGGVVLRTDLDATRFEVISGGLRNACDVAFTPDASCFTYDSDMEWDMGMPWYRPPRVVHVVPGADNGWRAGTGKWPDWYPDALGAVADTPPGSPTAVVHAGDGAFGVEWEGVLLLADWSYGRIWSLEPKGNGASFSGVPKLFAQGRPFNVSCMRFAPKPDGGLYVITGGRGTQSSLWRIGADSPQWVDGQVDRPPAMTQRIRLERDAQARRLSLSEVWRHLGTGDRAMSTSARLALRAFPPQEVHHQAMQSSDPPVMVDAFIFMAKSTIPFDVNDALRRLAAATTRTGVPTVQASVLRTMGIIMSRRGNPSLETIEAIVPTLTDMLRSHSTRVQREAAQLLVHLEADMTTWLLTHMEATHGKDALYWAKLARLHRGPWSAVQELHYLRWLVRQHDIVGGQSAGAFVQAFASRFMQDKPEAQRTALHAQLQRETLPVQAATKRAHVAHWTMDTLSGALQRDASRQVEQLQATLDGEALFREARCVECHRFRGRGGSSGPDLTGVGSRLSEADLLRAIVEPSRDVSDQYAATWIETDSGLFTGRLIDVDARRIVLDVDPFGGVESVAIGRSEIRSMEPSDVSTMPAGLLNTFDAAQIATLLDWLRRG